MDGQRSRYAPPRWRDVAMDKPPRPATVPSIFVRWHATSSNQDPQKPRRLLWQEFTEKSALLALDAFRPSPLIGRIAIFEGSCRKGHCGVSGTRRRSEVSPVHAGIANADCPRFGAASPNRGLHNSWSWQGVQGINARNPCPVLCGFKSSCRAPRTTPLLGIGNRSPRVRHSSHV